ncbi:MAG TPA: PqqD family peptide modification chaperone [Blastocatellia bacterium]|nr:PqqD family peptide modification chaperone [Blastocatellia bacterium]
MRKEREQSLPEARKEGLIVQHLPDEVLIYDQQRHKAHCLNRTAALVWERCDGKTTVAKIAEKLSKQTGKRVGEDMAWLAIEELAKSRLLEGPVGRKAAQGVSRREMMKRAGLAAAVALPVVTSIVAPMAAQAATCRNSGQACTTSSQCCRGLCSAGVCA